MTVEMVTAIVTVLVLVGAVAIRSVSGGRIEIKLTDAIIAAIAAVVVLLVGGRIAKFGVTPQGGLTVETAREAILTASATPIERQVSALPVGRVEVALKGGVSEIPSLVRKQVQGLEFALDAGGYEPHVMQEYLKTLTQYAFFQYVIILNRNLSFFGMIDARRLLAILQEGSGLTFASFADMLNRGDSAGLQRIPGMVLASAAVTRQTDKRDVLERMEKLGIDWLPVTKSDGFLDGIVNRSRLTASLILDVTNQLRASDAIKK